MPVRRLAGALPSNAPAGPESMVVLKSKAAPNAVKLIPSILNCKTRSLLTAPLPPTRHCSPVYVMVKELIEEPEILRNRASVSRWVELEASDPSARSELPLEPKL